MKVFNTTTKKIIAGGLTVAILVAAVISIYALMNVNDKFILEVKKDPLVLEYGTTISTDAREYLIYTADQEKIIKKVKVDVKAYNQEGKEYPAIGKYEVQLSYEKQKVTSTVEIKDTKAPMFNEINDVTFEQGTDFDYGSVITADDLQEIEYSFDTVAANKDVPDEYMIKVKATDKSGNESTKDIKAIVTAKQVVPEQEQPATDSSRGNTNITKPGNGTITAPAQPETPTPPAEHKHINAAFGKYFTTDSEANTWAENYIDGQPIGQYVYSGYGVHYCSCGLVSLSFY